MSNKKDLLSRLDKYGNLLVSCANAKNSDELLAVLERVAAPVQSYRRKRGDRHFTAAVNLYPGGAFGWEYQLDSLGKAGKPSNIIAFTAPLGVSLDWGICQKSSVSLFFSVIDVGAVTAFRLQDSVTALPELAWKNVFAPGAYLMLGIGRSPLSLGGGVQYGPTLRKITEGGAIIEASRFRWGVSLTVDVPLFFIHSGTYGKKRKK